jgi:hypothetical protein
MSDNEGAAICYRFDGAVDLLTAFEHSAIEHLEVSPERTIVIYSRIIFNLEVLDGQLGSAQTISVEVFDSAPNFDADTDSTSLIERLVEELATTIDADWIRQ